MKRQTGSAHVAIVIILVIALMGLLGFIFWQNYIQKDTESSKIPTPPTTMQNNGKSEPLLKFSSWNVEILKDDSSINDTMYENYDFEFAAVRSDDGYLIYSAACNGHKLGILTSTEKKQLNTITMLEGKYYNFEQAISECPGAATSTSGKDANAQLGSAFAVLKASLKTIRLME